MDNHIQYFPWRLCLRGVFILLCVLLIHCLLLWCIMLLWCTCHALMYCSPDDGRWCDLQVPIATNTIMMSLNVQVRLSGNWDGIWGDCEVDSSWSPASVRQLSFIDLFPFTISLWGSRVRWVWVTRCLSFRCLTSNKWTPPSKPQFSHLCNGSLIFLTCAVWGLVQNKFVINKCVPIN